MNQTEVETRRQVIDGELAQLRSEVKSLDKQHRHSRRVLINRMDSLNRERSKLRAGRRSRSDRVLDAHAQAGSGNVTRMREVFERLGKATAAQATAVAGYAAGHQVWAIRALVEDGVIQTTGQKQGRSLEYEFVKARNRVTRLKPGE